MVGALRRQTIKITRSCMCHTHLRDHGLAWGCWPGRADPHNFHVEIVGIDYNLPVDILSVERLQSDDHGPGIYLTVSILAIRDNFSHRLFDHDPSDWSPLRGCRRRNGA